MDRKFIYKCENCGKEYPPHQVKYLCDTCQAENTDKLPPKGILKTIYNYDKLKKTTHLKDVLIAEQFLDLLPINNIESLPNLRIGNTPLYKVTQFNEYQDIDLYLKDDSQNPTFSFKDRASALVSAFAKELGIKKIVAASTGNAGSSMAGICASQGQEAVIFVPEKAPLAKITQILMYGAQIVPVKGTYDDAFDFSIEASKYFSWFNRNTGYNPLTIEGKKTVAFELYQQLMGEIPHYIFVPVGDGVIISGVYKGFEDLLQLGIIDEMPVIIAVQAEGSNNLISNIHSDTFQNKPANTVADSISVDIPRNFYMARNFLRKYGGKTVQVTDTEIVEASFQLSKKTGIFAEPAAAAAFAGLFKARQTGITEKNKKHIVLLTGSGLKDLNAVNQEIKKPEAVECNMSSLKKLLHL